MTPYKWDRLCNHILGSNLDKCPPSNFVSTYRQMTSSFRSEGRKTGETRGLHLHCQHRTHLVHFAMCRTTLHYKLHCKHSPAAPTAHATLLPDTLPLLQHSSCSTTCAVYTAPALITPPVKTPLATLFLYASPVTHLL